MYDKGTNERKKMLSAFWMMHLNPTNNNVRYINSRAYEKLRLEYSKNLSDKMKILQIGSKNSQFDKKWFTNYETGESKPFKEKPNEKWIKGRNLFRGESTCIKYKLDIYLKEKEKAFNYWKTFIESNCVTLNEFSKTYNIPHQTLSSLFLRFIIQYKNRKHKSCKRIEFAPMV
jgi:hypothetical protein